METGAQDTHPAPQGELSLAQHHLRGPQAGVKAALCPRVTLRNPHSPEKVDTIGKNQKPRENEARSCLLMMASSVFHPV